MAERDLRAYLLGEASEDEAARLEGRLLEDDELFRTLESVEDDLFDDYARGRLASAEEERFKARYGADGERHRFARALARRVDAAPGVAAVPPRSVWRWQAPLAAAAAFVVIAGVAMMMRRAMVHSTAPPAVASRLAAPPAAEQTAVFALTLDTSRAAAAPATLTLPRNASSLQLRIRLNAADQFDTYALELRSAPRDSQVWVATGLHAVDEAGNLILTATIPLRDVPDGAYDLAVRGVRPATAAASAEDLGFASLKVVRVP